VKILFFAGVEGSGHHVLKAFFENIPYCPLPYEPKSWSCGFEWDKAELPQFVNQLRRLDHLHSKQCIHVLYDTSRPEVMQSYPCDGKAQSKGDPKVAHQIRTNYAYPRLDWIQEAVQQVPGTRLHVMQLHREMSDCLAASCVRRQFESCDMEAETLAYNGEVLLKHLQKIPPDQRSCFKYGRRESMEMAIKESFGSKYGDLVAQVYQDHEADKSFESSPEWDGFVSRMRGVEEPLLKLCDQVGSGQGR
jgi:hypothetical protein